MKTIAIFTFKMDGHEHWDPDSICKGITGSEEAVIYVAQSLARLGYKVVVFGDPSPDSPHTKEGANPRYIAPIAAPDRQWGYPIDQLFDIGIAWRMPWNGQAFRRLAKKLYLWPHDVCNYWVAPEQIAAFDDVLWLSAWQREQWASVNPDFARFTKIFGNGIDLLQFEPVQERANPYSCIYGSNYARGLGVLLGVWPAVLKRFPQATLDIYYGWQSWGLLSKEEEALMRKYIVSLQGVREHGLVSHEALNQAYARASFWTYPCISPETFCITALKAQMNGAVPVALNNYALAETVPHGYRCKSVAVYESMLLRAMAKAKEISLESRQKMGDFIRERYTWDKVAQGWKALFAL